MKSMLRDGHDIAMEIRFQRQVHKGAFLLLEGETDVKRFDPFIDATCETVDCCGRDNAIVAIKLLYEEGFSGAIAVVDADFDRLLSRLFQHEGIIYSECHDLDVDWMKLNLLEDYIREVGQREKVAIHCGSSSIFEHISRSILNLSLTRLCNQQLDLRVKFSNHHIDGYYSPFKFDLGSYLDEVFTLMPADDRKNRIINFVENKKMDADLDLDQVTNGHDFHVALGICLRDAIGNRANAQTWGKEVGMHFRLLCDDSRIVRMQIFMSLKKWQTTENYKLLNSRFFN